MALPDITDPQALLRWMREQVAAGASGKAVQDAIVKAATRVAKGQAGKPPKKGGVDPKWILYALVAYALLK